MARCCMSANPIPECLLGIICDTHQCSGVEVPCNQPSPDKRWYCTRPNRHDGPHIACFIGMRTAAMHNKCIWADGKILHE